MTTPSSNPNSAASEADLVRVSGVDEQDVLALMALDAGHPYRKVLDGRSRPSDASSSELALALPFILQVLAADAGTTDSTRTSQTRVSALCRYCLFLLRTDQRFLQPPLAFRDEVLQRYLANDGVLRRTTHRSRTALTSTLKAWRRAFPSDYPMRDRARADGDDPILAPVEDFQLDIAFDQIHGLRNPITRLNVRGALLLARGAGLDGGDLQGVIGNQIVSRPGAGLWVTLPDRDVPVLARYADQLAELAANRAERCMVANVVPPCNGSTPGAVLGELNRRLRSAGYDFRVGAERLRKAWLVEQVAANTPLRTLLAAAGLRSLRSLESLLESAPAPPENPTHLAYELGGVERGSGS